MKILSLAAPLLLCASLAAAQPAPVDLHEEVRREVELQFGDRLRTIEIAMTAAAVLFGLTFVGIVPSYFTLLRRAHKMVEEKLASVVKSRPATLIELIDERDADQRLRHESAVLVVASELATEGILRQTGFSDVTTLPPDSEAARAMPRHALVVFDLDRGCTEETAASLIERNSLESVLVYTAGRSELRGPRLTFANSPVTLFSRLMELIRFRKAMSRPSTR